MYLAEFLIAISLLLGVYYLFYRKKCRVEEFYAQFPSPPSVPILGHLLDFVNIKAFLRNVHRYIDDHGTILRIKIGPFAQMLLVSDYKMLEFLLSSQQIVDKSVNYRFLHAWLGTGVLTSPEPKWRTHRKMLTPAFHFKVLEQFVEIFETAGDILVKKLKAKDGAQSLEIDTYISLCNLDIVCESSMGTKVNAQENEDSPYVHSMSEMCRILITRVFSPLSHFDFIFRWTKDYEIQKKSTKILHDYANKVIASKLHQLKSKSPNNDQPCDIGMKKKQAFLDLILNSTVDGRPLTPEEIREEVDTFMFAGHGSSTSAITFILFCLANHPEVQKKVIEEQRELFGNDSNPVVTYDHLRNMKYLDLVVKETLRLYPSVPLIGRHAYKDITFDGKTIPKGVDFILFIRAIHLNPKYYPNPEKFDPERFLNVDEKHPFAYLPFSAGPRNCNGQKFAIAEIKSVVSKVVRNFHLTPAFPEHKLELVAQTILKSLNGIKIGIKSRRAGQ